MLSRYRILGKLGAGGMGVVYRAEDLTLKRTVALKVITGALHEDEHARARFLREARTAAGLNHPNVCTIHDFGEVQPGEEEALGGGERIEAGTPFISMELVEGRTLAALLRERRPLRFSELIDIAVQVGGGLAAAHASGVVHRDLKPANVMVSSDGRVKILDFGLAKPLAALTSDGAGTTSTETLPKELTTEGKIVGTVAYMSPEQATGSPVDSRSDVFSFGTMRYEMATGKNPFEGNTPVSMLGKILEAEPESIANSAPASPPELDQIVRRCIRKSPDERYNDTRDLVIALEELRQKTASGARSAASRWSAVRRGLLWAAALAGIVAVTLVGISLFWTSRSPMPMVQAPTHRQVTFTGTSTGAVVSPDGQFISYVEPGGSGGQQLMVQDLAGGKPLAILSAKAIVNPRWCPNGTELYAGTAENGLEVKGYLIPRLGGTPRPFPGYLFSAWSPDGKRIAGAWPALRKIEIADRATGQQRSIPLDDPFTWLNGLDWSPIGDRLAFATGDEKKEKNRCAIWTISSDGGRPRLVAESEIAMMWPRFSPAGDAVYYLSWRKGDAGTTLWKAKIDAKTGAPEGEPVAVLSGLDLDMSWTSPVEISRDGRRLFFTKRTTQQNLWLAELRGNVEGGVRTTQLTSGTSVDAQPKFSPDGRSLVFLRGNNVFTVRLDGSAPEQLTFGGAGRASPVWSPDGRNIAFVSAEGDTLRVWRMSAGGGNGRPFTRSRPGGDCMLAWAPGKRILYQKPENRNFVILDPSTEEETPLLKDESRGWVFNPVYSSDGTRVALEWNRADSPIPETDGKPPPTRDWTWVISSDGSVQQILAGDSPLGYPTPIGWSFDGAWVYLVASRELSPANHYNYPHPAIWKAPARGGPAVDVAKLPFAEVNLVGDVTRDGSRFVFSVVDTRTDAWAVENFDPDLQGK